MQRRTGGPFSRLLEIRSPVPADHRRSATGSPSLISRDTALTNPYRPPLTTPERHGEFSRATQLAFAGFAILSTITAWLTSGSPYITVIATAGSAGITLPFAHATDRGRLIWCFVLGMVLAIFGSVAVISLTHEAPNTYTTSAVYNDALDTILAFAIPIGSVSGALIAVAFSARRSHAAIIDDCTESIHAEPRREPTSRP